MWKVICLCLAIALIAIIMHPPSFEDPQKISDDPPASPSVPFHPNAVAVVQTHYGISTVPGTIVCDDLATVRLVFDLYNQAWEDGAQDSMTNGRSRTIRGPSASAPDPAQYGCSLLSPGTPVEVKNGDAFTTGIPQIIAKLPDGKMIRGVTLPSMLVAR